MDVVVENLTKSFGYQKAVDSVSFEVKKGEILGFLGPNGAGKKNKIKKLYSSSKIHVYAIVKVKKQRVPYMP